MDEVVLRAMRRWPNVPAVYGWLRLDRRGEWLIKNRNGGFERATHPAIAAFFGRNYLADDRGRWYVQNGPQQVFVTLEYTPLVYRLDDRAAGFTAHTGAAAAALRGLHLDDHNHLLLEADLGIGVIADRDLPAVLDRLVLPPGADLDTALLAVADGEAIEASLCGQRLRIAPIRRADVPRRFGFDPQPAPPAGEPDCA
ncbi:MAG TPA: DUF2946 family protein [Burkholderiales bacterium]